MAKSGRYDRRVTIQRPGPPIDDGYTTLPGALADYWTCAASWQPERGDSQFENSGREALSRGTLWVRWNPTTAAIRETDVVLFGDRLWAITSATEEGRRDEMKLVIAAKGADDLEAPES